MATSLSSQIQAIKSTHKGTPDPIRRPLTRPSVLFGPKEAADIDLRSILSIAISGLETLVEHDDRFGKYRGTLFSQTSLELDRGKMVKKEEDKLNRSICSYLRLLTGHLDLPAALKTLEYLIRRYEVHVFNTEELALCALPYHDTRAFVRIVQLLDLGNGKWAFLEGVKTSGAPPPRKVIVQQCIRDKGILETLCDYAKPMSEFQHARPVICFCTAVIVESLGSVAELDTDTVNRVLPFVWNGLNPVMKGSRDHKAGALMVVGLLATRATLGPKLSQNLAFFIARVAKHDAEQSADLPWIRVTIMAIVSLLQSQPTQIFPKKTLDFLKEIRDFTGVLSGLSREFNIQKFVCLYIEALVDYSSSDDSYLGALTKILETLQLKEIIEKVVSKILTYCLKLSQSTDTSDLHQRGEWAKKILVVIENQYPSELRGAVRKFLEGSKMNLKEGDSNFRNFCQMFDGSLEMPSDIPDSKFLFYLEHPKAEVRRAALSDIAASGILRDISANPQKLLNVQNAIVRRLYDEDLSVIQAALYVGLSGVVNPPCFLRAYREVLFRCIHIINGSTSATSQASDVAILCLERMVLDVPLQNLDYLKEVAAIIFPLLLVLPKTWRLNLKALEIAKQIKLPFYYNIAWDPTSSEKAKALILLCETVKDQGLVQKKCKDKRKLKHKFIASQLCPDENDTSCFNELCLKIVQLISCPGDDSETPVKLAAISSFEVLSKELPADNLIFSTCLACIVKYIGSSDLAISSACLRSTGALINVLGSKALPHLPRIMKNMLEKAHEISNCPIGNSKYSHLKTSDGVLNHKWPLMISIVITLEAVLENLGGFLNPYLEDILDLVVLHSEYVLDSDAKVNLKAAAVRKLLTEKIPVRLMLTPLLKMYSSALRCGESSLCLVFEMLASIVGVLGRPSIGTYHVKIFEQCLTALDIRCQLPESIKNINKVEESVVNAMIVLTMKLTETMFRPLFVHSLEWADSKLEGSENASLDRMITFYKLVNRLVSKQRSLFVPYFKYLLEGCTRYLTEDQDVVSVPLTQKRKKAKHGDAHTLAKARDILTPKQWHLRALMMKSLYQCFLYDTTDLKFLDASNFQVLLKPVVSQIMVEPPTIAEGLLDIPTVEEVDETLVLCLGQMAVTAHSDVLWKPLNHEVLMQTRSEKNRPKILGLKVVKYVVEHLKE